MLVPSRIVPLLSRLLINAGQWSTLARFHRNAHNFQLGFSQAILEGKERVLPWVGCGTGKTPGFWIYSLHGPPVLPLLSLPQLFLAINTSRILRKLGSVQ